MASGGFNFGDGGTFDPENHDARGDLSPSAPAGAGQRTRRQARSAEAYRDEDIDAFVAPTYPKSDQHAALLRRTLEDHHMFKHLDDAEIDTLVGAMHEQEAKGVQGGAPFRERGSAGDSKFYVIAEGSVHLDGPGVDELRSAGGHFGELQLQLPQPTVLTARVPDGQTASLYYIDRPTYQQVSAKASRERRATYSGFLRDIKFLSGLKDDEGQIAQLADALKTTDYKDGAKIIEYGSKGEWFHLIVEGTVDVIGRKSGKAAKICDFTVGDCVGEMEFINDHTCVADCVARGAVRTAKMQKKHFEMLMGPVVDLLKETAATSEVYEYYRATQQQQKPGVPKWAIASVVLLVAVVYFAKTR